MTHQLGLFRLCRPSAPLSRRLLGLSSRARCPMARMIVHASSSSPSDQDPQQQQQQQQQPPKPQLPDWVVQEIRVYDDSIAKMRTAMKEQQREVDKFNEQIEELQVMGAPGWTIAALEKIRDTLQGLLRYITQRAADMEAGRDKYVSELTEQAVQEQRRQRGPEDGEGGGLFGLEDLTEEQRAVMEKPETLATTFIFQSLLLATLISFVGSLFGADSGRLLVWPAADSAAALGTWAEWTVPYVGATALACTLLPSLTTRRLLRGTNANRQLFVELDPATLALLALAMGASQVLVFQGVWMDAALNFYRGGGSGAEFLHAENLRGSLGSLVASPGLAFLAGPGAVLSVALLEAGWWAGYSKIDSIFPGLVDSEEREGFHAKYVEGEQLQDAEVVATAARIFFSSCWLGSEALLGGSLWYSIGTSAVGLLTAMLIAKGTGGSDSGSSSSSSSSGGRASSGS